MEKFEIKDFLGIKDINIEIKQINILIRPQASGKSVIAKLLYYFNNFMFEIINAAEESKNKIYLYREYKQKFEEYFSQSSWGDKNFKIKYYIDGECIEIQRNKSKNNIILRYSDFYKNRFTELRDVITQLRNQEIENERQITLGTQLNFSYNVKTDFLRVARDKNRFLTFSQLYIPAGRSFFSNLKNSIFSFLYESNAVDPFLISFGTYYEKLKSPVRRVYLSAKVEKKSELYNNISSLNKKILCGKYMQKKGEDFLEVDRSRQIKVANSSSGQQETLPLAIILGTIAFSNPKVGGDSIYIEEPEAHIFPSAQRNVVELISTVYNARKESIQFLVTTHSPYILTAFNNLLQAGIIATDADEEKTKKINKLVPKSRLLKPEEIAVYSVEGGYCKSIVDEETGLIDANIIDEVSNELAVEFDELLDLEE